MGARIVVSRELRHGREQRGLRDVDLAHRLAEEDLRRRLDAVGTRAEVDLVQIELEDGVLREGPLQLPRHPRFLQFARELLLAADLVREHVAGQLHRDGREPL
jgi:hypothetical protein